MTALTTISPITKVSSRTEMETMKNEDLLDMIEARNRVLDMRDAEISKLHAIIEKNQNELAELRITARSRKE
jgi:uncharacterized membrane protein